MSKVMVNLLISKICSTAWSDLFLVWLLNHDITTSCHEVSACEVSLIPCYPLMHDSRQEFDDIWALPSLSPTTTGCLDLVRPHFSVGISYVIPFT